MERTLESIAKLPSRQFRTMLRVLARGQNFADAQALLRHRGASAGTELLADDVNTVLSAAVFCDPQRMINLYLARAKKAGALAGLSTAAALAEFGRHLEAWDLGAFPDLADAAYARSPAIHADRAQMRKDGGGGGGGGGGVGCKRPREEEAGVGEGAAAEAAAAAAPGSEAGAGAAAPAGFSETTEAEAEAFKRLTAVLHDAFTAPAEAAAWPLLAAPSAPADADADAAAPAAPAVAAVAAVAADCSSSSSGLAAAAASPAVEARARAWLRARWLCAGRVFGGFSDPLMRALGPNARSLVLMVHAALSAGEVDECRRYLALLTREGGPCPRAELYTVLQPAMLARLAAVGALSAGEAAEALRAPEHTPKWFFLKAAYEASKGDQFGSKHGAVLTKGGRFLSAGHNHRYGVPGDAHVRVMHSEVHALVKLPDLAAAAGGELWIVELDGEGVGYEEGVACVMCTKAATRVGVGVQHFSSHSGVRRLTISHKPSVQCESLELALRRVYPPGSKTENPDLAEEAGFCFSGGGDPGRGREAMGGGGSGSGSGSGGGGGGGAGAQAAAPQ